MSDRAELACVGARAVLVVVTGFAHVAIVVRRRHGLPRMLESVFLN
jgi:hypothetical protein